jgi:hypothetical protein
LRGSRRREARGVRHLHAVDACDDRDQQQVEGNLDDVGADAERAGAHQFGDLLGFEAQPEEGLTDKVGNNPQEPPPWQQRDRGWLCQSAGLALAFQISFMA